MIDFNSMGRMLSGTKISRKGEICVYNANVCLKSVGKIWFGDLDLARDAEDLKRLPNEKGETVYVLREMDARFKNESAPKFDKAVATFAPGRSMELHDEF